MPLTPSPFEKNNAVTFGVCADPARINQQSVACWSQILKKIPDAKLKFFHSVFPALICEQHLLAQFTSHGIDEARIEFHRAGNTHARRFEAFAEIDIMLSPFPITDDLHLIDALWMGCPVVALAQGVRGASRAASVLVSANQNKFLLQNEDEYIACAVSLAENPSALVAGRNTLRQDIKNSPIADVEGTVGAWFATIKTLI